MDKLRPSFKSFFWSPLETVEAAKIARMPALILSIFAAALWSVIAIIGFFSPSEVGHWAILYAVLLIAISWGLLRMLRVAAIAGLIFSFVGFVFHWGSSQAILDAIILYLDVLAIRGIFAYVRLSADLKTVHSV